MEIFSINHQYYTSLFKILKRKQDMTFSMGQLSGSFDPISILTESFLDSRQNQVTQKQKLAKLCFSQNCHHIWDDLAIEHTGTVPATRNGTYDLAIVAAELRQYDVAIEAPFL